jgi:type IV pilus assembly protein PilE
MNTMQNTQNAGFSLIELMVVVAIIAILASLAFASYDTNSAQRSLAFTEISALGERMETHKIETGSYTNAGPVNVDPNIANANSGVPSIYVPDTNLQYTLTISAATATSYSLLATPTGAQAGDGIIVLTSTGRKFWDQNNNGSTADTGENDWKKG